jgi:hypothetical protein
MPDPSGDAPPDEDTPPADMPDAPEQSVPDMADMKMDPPDLPEFDFGVEDMAPVPFTITAVIPPSGPVSGGTRVRVRGASIPQGAQVFFGAQRMESPAYEVDGITGNTPPGAGPGPVSVKVIAPDGQVRTLEQGFTYTAQVRVDSVTPDRLPTAGGVEVEVRGQGFAAGAPDSVAVTFSGTPALRVKLLSDDLLRVVVPPRPVGPADVRVITPAGAATAERAVTYFAPLTLEAVEPASGQTSGGEEVVLLGQGFATGMTARFDGLSAQVIAVDVPAGMARVRTPAHPAGLVDVSISTPAGESALAQGAFYYRPDNAPRLVAVRPAFGSTDGGEQVRLIGVGLDRAGARFMFGGLEAPIVSSSATSVIVTAPAQAAGVVDVRFFEGQQLVNALPAAYTYIEGLAISAVDPAVGPVAGGQEVTITGRGLAGTSRVTFGGLPAQIISAQPGALRVRTPAHAEGLVAVRIERDGLSATAQDAYTFEGELRVWGFTPVRGAVSGGTYVEVRGQGFAGRETLAVTLGGRPGAEVRRLDAHTLSFRTPASPAGDATLVVARGQRSAPGPYPYQYFEPAARFGGASGGSIDGAVNVTVYSTAGAPIQNAFVMLSTRPDTRYQGFTNAAGQITLSGPDVFGEQTVSATAAGFSTASIQSVDAENITIFLNKLDPTPGGGGGSAAPPSALIKGRVTSPGKLANPDDQLTYDMAIVRTTSPSPSGGNPNPGPGSVVIGDGNYQINTRVGDLAVVALCGVYNDRTQVFDPQYMGVVRYLQISDQQILNVDVVCNIPLEQVLPVKLVNPIYSPEGPNINVVSVVWSFGFEGYFASPSNARGLTSLLSVNRQPALAGVLADVTLLIQGGSYTGDFSPLTQSGRRNVTSTSQLVQLPPLLDVPEPVSPLPGAMIVNDEIRWQASGPYRPDLISLIMRDARGIPVWSIILPGDATSARIPRFPDLSSRPLDQRPQPYPTDLVYLTITSARLSAGGSINTFSYQDLDSGRWEAYSLNRWALQFPPQP